MNQLFYQIEKTDKSTLFINVYSIGDSKPFISIEIPINSNIVDEINNYLNDNGYGDDYYTIIGLPTKEEQKQIALEQLGPYFKNPKTCGYEMYSCKYLTNDGKMCVVGKNLLPEKLNHYKNEQLGILEIFGECEQNQTELFKSEIVNKFTDIQWEYLQSIHDYISENKLIQLKKRIDKLGLFTYEELEQYSKTI